MSVELARVIESAEAAAYVDLLRAAPTDWRCSAEAADGGWLLVAPPLDVLLFNRLIGGGVTAPARQQQIVALVERLRGAGVRNYGVQVGPWNQPREMRQWLEEAGLVKRDRWTKVYRDASPAVSVATDLRISVAGDDDAIAFAEVTTKGFGMPPAWRSWIAAGVGRPGWRHYLARDGDEPVAGAALRIDGDVAWLGVACTLPQARRRGAQGALMARRIDDGRALGCRWFVTETAEDTPERPNPSFRNMSRAGFSVAYHRDNFMPPA